MVLFWQRWKKDKGPVPVTDPASITSIEVNRGFRKPVTNDEYPWRDVKIHHSVAHMTFRPERSLWQAPTSRVLRVGGVWVPRLAAAALGDRPDYVRLGLPAYVRLLFLGFESHADDYLDDPLYGRTADVWWVRAWPSDALATTVAADGTEKRHDAAAILRQTGQGFTVTADLVFDFFYRIHQGGAKNREIAYDRRGPVVRVVRSVLSSLHDPRPDPKRRADVNERNGYGCHLPGGVVAPDPVLTQLENLGLAGGPTAAAAAEADPAGADDHYRDTARRTEAELV